MKKLLFTFSLLVAMSSFALAQGVVNINGYVTDANGNAMGGYPVEIMSDSLTGVNFYTMTYTNNNGYYSTSATVGAIAQGGFYVWTQDSCTSGYLSQTVYFSPNMMTLSNVDFSICPSGSGSSCAASFTQNTTPTGVVTYAGMASGGQAPYTYSWALGNGMTSTSANPVATYASGMYLTCLTISDAGGCTSTYCDTINVNVGGGGSSCSTTMSSSSNNTLSVNFSATATGTAPFTYVWDFGDSTGTSTTANPTYTYGSNGTYYACVTIVDANGCVATDCSIITVNVATSGTLNVYVVADSMSGLNAQAEVFLIQYDATTGTLTAIQTATTQQGSATFTNVPFGNYLVKAALLSTDPNYANYLPTYFTQSLTWDNATDVQVTPTSNSFTYIQLVQGTNVGTGPGFIGGLVTQGANGPGDPVDGALVILYDANMNPIAYTYSDEDGEYSFDNLPYGVYYIYIDELGLISAPVEITLSATTPSMDQVHFEVGTSYVMFTNTNEILSVSGLKVYPNPVTDQLYMQFELDQTIDAEISIINITGQVLSNFQQTLNGGSNLLEVPTNELPAGIYTIHLKSKAGIITQKFIKQ
jgi:PKD repeat protein